jgi:carbon starvation protein
MGLGVIFARPVVVAPVLQMAPEGAPPILPFLFITIACGAISGFHALVSSGTSSKQLKNESDIRFIGYGGMLTEGFLSVLVIIAVAAGIGMYVKGDNGEVLRGIAAWNHHYSSWEVAMGLTAKITAFVNGAANMISSLGIPLRYGYALVGVLVASFAGTTLDTATRIQRYVITELALDYNIKPLQKRYPATALAVLAAGILAFSQGGGTGALILWPLFGTSNQLLAGLVLLVATVYLIKRGSRMWVTGIPMLFMFVNSSWAMIVELGHYFQTRRWHLFTISSLLLILGVWMIYEAVLCVKAHKGSIGSRGL